MSDVLEAGHRFVAALASAVRVESQAAVLTALAVGGLVFLATNAWKVALAVALVQLVVARCARCPPIPADPKAPVVANPFAGGVVPTVAPPIAATTTRPASVGVVATTNDPAATPAVTASPLDLQLLASLTAATGKVVPTAKPT